jgi:hypothetical protein
MEALFREDRRMVDAMMAKEKYAGKVGALKAAITRQRATTGPRPIA